MEHVNVGADKHKHNGRRWLEKKLGKKTVLLALCVVAALVSSIVSSFRVETVALLQATTTHTSVTTNTSRGVDVDELQLLKPEEQKQEREHEGSSQRHSPDDHHENKKASAAMLSSIAIIESNNTNTTGRCAINLYGLPRGFKNLVLPSVIRNVIGPNLEHECDYFLHYYRITREGKSTTTKGGTIYPDDVFLLEPAVHNAAAKAGQVAPHVGFRHETEENFQEIHRDLNNKIKDRSMGKKNNKYLVPSYGTQTTLNVVKMWHSQTEVWRLMEEHAKQFNKTYTRVAMFRSDVVFVTPIDIFRKQNHDIDYENRHAVVPHFGKYPVNDRMMYGPYEAVKIWATERLPRVHEHVQKPKTGGLHSERYLKRTIFPLIRELGFSIQEDKDICFFRCRADGPIIFKDCQEQKFKWSQSNITDQQRILEELFGRPCTFNKKKGFIYCNEIEVKNATASSSSAVANARNATVSASAVANGKNATVSPITLAHE